MKLTIIIPAYNEEAVIRGVLKSVKRQLRQSEFEYEIIVVNDGSTDNTVAQAKKEKVKIISHPINRGLGGALGTGLAYAKKIKAKLVVTFDSDGQHDPKDIVKIIQPIISGEADVVIGSRTITGIKQIPLDRRVLIGASNILTTLLFSTKTTDSQSGFRAVSKKAFQKISIITQGMEVSSEFFSEVKQNNLKMAEIPIKVIYNQYSRDKGQSNTNAFSVIAKLFLRLAR